MGLILPSLGLGFRIRYLKKRFFGIFFCTEIILLPAYTFLCNYFGVWGCGLEPQIFMLLQGFCPCQTEKLSFFNYFLIFPCVKIFGLQRNPEFSLNLPICIFLPWKFFSWSSFCCKILLLGLCLLQKTFDFLPKFL